MHATSLRGGAVIKGSTAAKARDLRDKVRAGQPAAPPLTADSLNMLGASKGKAGQRAALKQASLADLKAVDAENARRAALLGKGGQVSATHQLVKDEIAARKAGSRTVNAAYSWDDLAAVVELSAKTAALEVTPAPYGKPGGPGLYGVAGNKHSDYYEQIVKALMEKRGMDKGRASAIAWGVLRKWAHGGGGVHSEVAAAASRALAGEAAASARAHAHAVTWHDHGLVIEMGFNSSQVRVPAGQAGGGQFGSAGGGAAAGQQPKGAAKPPPAPKPTAHQLHVAHVAHVTGSSTQKAELLVTAQDDKTKAAALIKQRDALAAGLASAGGKTSSGQAGAKTASTAKTKSTAPAAAAGTTAAAPKAASTSTTASTKTAAATTATASAKAGNTAQVKAQIAQLNLQIDSLLQAAADASAQAAKMQ